MYFNDLSVQFQYLNFKRLKVLVMELFNFIHSGQMNKAAMKTLLTKVIVSHRKFKKSDPQY